MTEPDVQLRPAHDDDVPAIAELWYHGWRDGHLGHVSPELLAARTQSTFTPRAAERVGESTVAVVAGEVAGFVTVIGDEVEQVYVASRHRGSGVADVLLTEAERQVRAAGHPATWLAVVAGNARARRFYERRGWSDGGSFDYAADSADGPIPVVAHRYVKDLTS
jgi:GNAT superfamily N-acetyltransferase